jgi:BirA family biotin operon repressor/biotin-[acetyl-CoA-carboxylase] ligase
MEHKTSIQLIHKEITASTMTEAKDLINCNNTTPHKFLIVADEQTDGQGRNGNAWHSPPGGLWFTYAFQTASIPQNVTLFLGHCLHKVLSNQYPILADTLLIKWPNDLLAKEKKLSGLLVSYLKDYLLIGVGINTNNDLPSFDSFFQPVGLKQLLGFEVSNSALLLLIISMLEDEFKVFNDQDLIPFHSYINAHLYGNGKELAFNTGKALVRGICRGIDSHGALLLEAPQGSINAYLSGTIISSMN